MDGVSHVSLSLATALERAMDVTANNVANADTDGFRAERVSFASFLAPAGGGFAEGTAYAVDRGSWLDSRPGALLRTDDPLDVALSGPGHFAYRLPDGEVGYGRDGRFSITAEGVLVSRTGHPVLDEGGGEVVIPEGADGPLVVAPDGSVSVGTGGPLARIGLYDLGDLQSLARRADGMLVPPDGGAALADPASDTELAQGFAEQSNVEPVLEMTRMIEIQRAYDRATNVMRTHDDLSRDAVRRLARQT